MSTVWALAGKPLPLMVIVTLPAPESLLSATLAVGTQAQARPTAASSGTARSRQRTAGVFGHERSNSWHPTLPQAWEFVEPNGFGSAGHPGARPIRLPRSITW